MMICWLEDAVKDLKSLRNYIAKDNVVAARKVVNKILQAIKVLGEHPEIGRRGRVSNTRELIVADVPYLVPYRVKNNTVEILRVFHCAMQWPEEL